MIYDVIVIGDDLSSYVAAAESAAGGMKTALLSETGMEDTAVIGDVSFHIDPTPLSGFVFSEAGNLLLKKLNIAHKVFLLDPGYQVILPEHRIDFFHDQDKLVEEMTREFPQLSGELKSFYKDLETLLPVLQSWLKNHPGIQPFGLRNYFHYWRLMPHMARNGFGRLKINQVMSRHVAFRKVIEAQQHLLSFRQNHPHSFFSLYPLCVHLFGVGCFPQGKQTIYDAAVQKVISSGGIYLPGVQAMSIKKGTPFEITYHDSDHIASKIEARQMIVSTKWPNMYLLIDKKKKISFGDWIRPVHVTHCPFTLHLGIKPSALPEKMARHVAVVPDITRDVYDDNLMILYSCAENDKDLSAPKIPLSVTVFLPNDYDTWTEDHLTQKAQSILNRLEIFLPFLKENIEFYDLSASMDVSKKQRQLINSKYRVHNACLTGLAAKNHRTRFKKIYLTGASLLLDIGFDGEILSGINAAHRVLHQENHHET